MTTVKENELCIIILETEPEQRRNWLIKALAAAMRWRSYYPVRYKEDDHHQHVLSQLLEELANKE